MKRILVTGAAGFIGFHLACHLHRRGDWVVGLDNFNDYYISKLKRDRAKILFDQGIDVFEGDICDQKKLLELVKEYRITHIAHLAAQAGVRYSLINPEAYVRTNIEGFLSVLEVCRQCPGIPLVYASSSSVYGNNTKVPFSVEDTTDAQASFYGVTKKSNELMAYSYHHLYQIPVTGLRFFTVYGPWGRPDMAYFLFAKAIVEDRPIDLYCADKMKRDFTYIDDIVQGTAAAIDLEASLELFNLGNHQPEMLSILVSTIEEALGKKAQIRHLPMQPGDVTVTYADISHSQKKLGFSPSTSLQKGIPQFIEWFREYTR